MTDQEMIQNTAKEIMDPSRYQVVMNKATIMQLIAQLQLALRHPDNTGPSAEASKVWIVMMRNTVFSDSPACQEMIDQGFDEKYDIPAKAEVQS